MTTPDNHHEGNGQEVIRIEGLVRRFGRLLALDDVSLCVRSGTVHGLVGENGAGKTTLLEHILGGYRPQAGTVSVFGRDPVKDPVDVLSRIGYLSEDRDIPGWMRVGELMNYTKAFYPTWDDAYVEAMLERFDLDSTMRIKSLSRGERAKAGLLCAIAYRPSLLLLDEPSSGLDVRARRDILEAIVRTVADEGRTVVFSSHLLDEVERVSDNITMLHKGKVILDGALDHIKERFHTVVLRFHSDLPPEPILPGQKSASGNGKEWRFLCEADKHTIQKTATQLRAHVVEMRPPSLEELFLALTKKQ